MFADGGETQTVTGKVRGCRTEAAAVPEEGRDVTQRGGRATTAA